MTGPTTGSLRVPSTRARVDRSTGPLGSSRDRLVDAGFTVALVIVGAVGWASVFDGLAGVAVAVVGGVVGAAAAWLGAARRLDPLLSLLVIVVAYVAGAGPAVPDAAVAGMLPGPATPGALLDGLVSGWSALITTAAPVGLGEGLGVVPYTCGFLAGVGAMVVAARSDTALWPTAPPLAALVAGLLFGDFDPVNVPVQGVGFVLVAVAWGSVRSNRPRRSLDGEVYWPRIVGGLVMLVVVGSVAQVAAPVLPGVETTQRRVLRQAVPPFDPSEHPSPLAGLRTFRKKNEKVVYLQAEGIRKGDLIRLATMDTYDGLVWSVGGSESSGRFDRVGAQIRYGDRPETGDLGRMTPRSVTVTVEEYQGVWVPTIGVSESVTFAGTGAEHVRSAFRFDRSTGTGAVVTGTREGLVVSSQARVLARTSVPADQQASAQPCSGGAHLTDQAKAAPELAELQAMLADFTGGAEQPFARALAIEKTMNAGFFSDDPDGGEPIMEVRAGHSLAALRKFLGDEQLIGNAEQYAASMAVLANLAGLPARVVMGFRSERAGQVALQGSHADAWVEVCFAEIGWVPFRPTPDDERVPTQPPDPRNPEPPDPEPPAVYQQVEVPETIPENVNRRNQVPKPPKPPVEDEAKPWMVGALLRYLGVPLVLLLAAAATIIGLKALRRRRRRTSGSVVDQINGAWLEAVDRLRDLGHRPLPSATRRELAGEAASVGLWPSGLAFAHTIDAHMFGPDDPVGPVVSTAWTDLDEQVRVIHEPLTRRQRLRAALSLASLRKPRARSATARGRQTPTDRRSKRVRAPRRGTGHEQGVGSGGPAPSESGPPVDLIDAVMASGDATQTRHTPASAASASAPGQPASDPGLPTPSLNPPPRARLPMPPPRRDDGQGLGEQPSPPQEQPPATQ